MPARERSEAVEPTPARAARAGVARTKRAAGFPARVIAAIEARGSLKVRAGRAAHRFLGIWAVVVEGRVFVRSWNDKPAGWYRAWRADPEGAILVGDEEISVRAAAVKSARLLDAISARYLEKYWRPSSAAYARGMDTPARRATTLELAPLGSRRSAGASSGPAPRRRS